MGFVRIFWKKNIQEAFLPKTSIVGQIVFEILAQLCSDDSIVILLNFGRICISFWQEGILDVFLLEYPDESHSFTNCIVMMSSL